MGDWTAAGGGAGASTSTAAETSAIISGSMAATSPLVPFMYCSGAELVGSIVHAGSYSKNPETQSRRNMMKIKGVMVNQKLYNFIKTNASGVNNKAWVDGRDLSKNYSLVRTV